MEFQYTQDFNSLGLDRNATCFFAGEEKLPSRIYSRLLVGSLIECIYDYIAMGYQNFLFRSKRGFEMLAAETVLYIKNTHPHIKLFVLVPSYNMFKNWQGQDKIWIERLLIEADGVYCDRIQSSRGSETRVDNIILEQATGAIFYVKRQSHFYSNAKRLMDNFAELKRNDSRLDAYNLYSMVARKAQWSSLDKTFYQIVQKQMVPEELAKLMQKILIESEKQDSLAYPEESESNLVLPEDFE